MAILESDVDVAGQIATKIAGSLDGANNSSGAILSDTQTTVAGNTNAQAATNLQIVASEFEAADQTIRQFISASSLPSPQGGAQK